ncbi:12267_t:CDS:1 [Funneliformis geosporum]|uniref:6272_t:CDS:1 n=1 Tax=Funneliformis geosporum TaxID=1117311 RepID=A0A9W4SEH1_9GLOM|nr:6272_t:CDS:1 [Funneliformis geosporum]CAI2181331.1 12267_t:CDS:1 [Funneliformis geosporum]
MNSILKKRSEVRFYPYSCFSNGPVIKKKENPFLLFRKSLGKHAEEKIQMRKLSGTASKIWKKLPEKIHDYYRKQYEINRDFQSNVSSGLITDYPTSDDITAIVSNENDVSNDLDFTIFPCENRKNCPICLKYFPAEQMIYQQFAIPENLSEINPVPSYTTDNNYYMSFSEDNVINQQQFLHYFDCSGENCINCLARNLYQQQFPSPNYEIIPLENTENLDSDLSNYIDFSFCDTSN